MYLTENRFGRKKMSCTEENHSNKCHMYAKGFLDANSNEAVIDKISIFTKLPQISHIHTNFNF